MKCKACGHEADDHLYGLLCNGGTACTCKRSQRDVMQDEELDRLTRLVAHLTAYKAEALAARELIDAYQANFTIINHVADFERAQAAYLAARVKEEADEDHL